MVIINNKNENNTFKLSVDNRTNSVYSKSGSGSPSFVPEKDSSPSKQQIWLGAGDFAPTGK